MSATRSDHAVIALVASAGGLDAVSRVLGGLPEASGASLIALIHQDPARTSQLVEILGRQSALPVAEAAHDAPLPAGAVMVVPPGKHLLITAAARTALIVSGPPPPSRPSADLLLASMAASLGGRAVAVVLSGGGHDGATGATAVHVLGGSVVATDEASSQSFSMPGATIARDHAIDEVVALDDVAQLLTALVAARGAG